MVEGHHGMNETVLGSDGDDATATRRTRHAAGQDPDKRRQILEGAHRVFTDMGFDAASMNDITREAGVSKGTIYVYFANKEELFVALIEQERGKIFDNLYTILSPDQDLRETLTRFGNALTSKITQSNVVKAQRTIIGVTERMPELGARFYRGGPMRGHELLKGFLAGAHARGELDVPDPALAAHQFMDLCSAGLFRRCLFGHQQEPPSPEQIAYVVDAAVDLIMAGYAPGRPHTNAPHAGTRNA